MSYNEQIEYWLNKEVELGNGIDYFKTYCTYCKKEHLCNELDYISSDNESIMYCHHYKDHFRN